MPARARCVLLFDVDNTLLDNDAVTTDLRNHLDSELGPKRADDYFELFEQLRSELGYADYLGTLQRYRNKHPHDVHILQVSSFLIDYPFASRLYPGALDVLARCSELGTTAILSDGDVVFQPRKIDRSGVGRGVGGRIMIYIHKETELEDVERRYPAEHYVLVDDKLRILTAVKKIWGQRVTTVFPRQGHYATDAAAIAGYPRADVTIERIADLADVDRAALGIA